MARRCELTGKAVLSGNNVSHANNKTRRRFLPNLHEVSFYSEQLNRKVKLKVSTRAIRSVDKNGFDSFVLNQPEASLSGDVLALRKSIESSKAAIKTSNA